MTATQSVIEVNPETAYREPGDHDKFQHYCPKEQLLAAQVEGTIVVALCGKVWRPTHFVSTLPVCPDCRERYEALDATSDKTMERNS